MMSTVLVVVLCSTSFESDPKFFSYSKGVKPEETRGNHKQQKLIVQETFFLWHVQNNIIIFVEGKTT